MGDLTNKSLALLLLSAVFISILGTFLVLNKFEGNYGPTGFGASGTGLVNLTVSSTISITTNESALVNFGVCTLNESGAIYINSMKTENNSVAGGNYCASDNLPNNISVRNDGNVAVNVTIKSSNCSPGTGNVSCVFLNYSLASTFADNGLFQYQTSNYGRYSYTGGCTTPNATWTSFNDTATNYIACYGLATAVTANSFVTDFRLRLPKGLPIGSRSAVLTYTAS